MAETTEPRRRGQPDQPGRSGRPTQPTQPGQPTQPVGSRCCEDSRDKYPAHASSPARPESSRGAFVRAENEDDDGYDPYSDRPCDPEPLWERDPWG